MNNLNEIRKLYESTQEDVAQVLGVSRVTISKLENDKECKLSTEQKEKLSIYFGIGPEYFGEKELDATAKEYIVNGRKKINKKVDTEAHSQVEIVNKLLEISPIYAMKNYMISTKILLVKADELTIEQFKDIIEVNKKLGSRLEKMLNEKEEVKGKSISEEINSLLEKYE